MSTPKEKLIKSQNLNAKKKKFFKVLQSSNFDGNFCATLNDRLKSEFDAKMQIIFQEQIEMSNLTIKEVGESMAVNDKHLRSSKPKKITKNNKKQKAVKRADLVCGLNETLKAIQNQQVAMVLVDQHLATNLSNVLHKLCATNQVFCLDLDLAHLKDMMKMSNLSVMALRKCVQQDESIFNSIYQFLTSSVFKSRKGMDSNETVVKEEEPKEVSAKSSGSYFSASINYYLANNSDPYNEIMRKRLRQVSDDKKDADFRNQISFISISHTEKEVHFPDYENGQKQNSLKFDIIIDHKSCKEQSAKSANKLAEKLFDIDKLDSKLQFKSPKLVKGQMTVELSNSKRKKTASIKATHQNEKRFKK